MAFSARQISVIGAAAAVPALVQGTTGTQFKIVPAQGTLQDPIPVILKNEDTVNTCYWGGSDCDATHGQSIPPLGTVPMNLYGASEIPYLFAATTLVVSVVCGRQ